MERKDVEKKYHDYGCINYKLRNKEDLRNIIGLNLDSAKYWNELSDENKLLTERFLISYLNGCGLMYREGYKIAKAYVCQMQELLTEPGEDGCRTIVGHMVLNLNNTASPKVERVVVDEDYVGNEDKYIWRVDKCNNQDTFLRVDLIEGDGRAEWFHVYVKNGEVEFY